MFASSGLHDTPNDRGGIVDFAVIDAGAASIAHGELVAAIVSILDGRVAEVARDRNSVCYRVRLSGSRGAPGTAIVKVPRPGPQRTNGDATFAGEASVLASLPAAGIVNAPRLLARVAAAGSHFLFTTELPGRHPDALLHPLDGTQLRAILDGLYAMDRRFFMHYDLKAANILIDGDRARFIDFEFARFEGPRSSCAPQSAAFCEDFNVSGNPLFPARSNVANFEFRALHRYLLDLGATRTPDAARALHCEWLRRKSAYHRRMAGFFAELSERSVEAVAGAGRTIGRGARGRLRAAAAHESLLARLFRHPNDAVARVERMLMGFRCATFERRTDEARRLQDATLAEIGNGATLATDLPDAYKKATARTFDLVRRSIHPGT